VSDVAIDGSEALGVPVTVHAEQTMTAISGQRILSDKTKTLR
jgi:hypothetical protein